MVKTLQHKGHSLSPDPVMSFFRMSASFITGRLRRVVAILIVATQTLPSFPGKVSIIFVRG